MVFVAIRGDEEDLTQAQALRPQVVLIGLDMPGLELIFYLRKVFHSVGIML